MFVYSHGGGALASIRIYHTVSHMRVRVFHVLRSRFAADGTMLHCSTESALIS